MVVTRLALSALLKRISSRVVLLASIARRPRAARSSCDGDRRITSSSLAARLLIGAGLAAVFPVVLGYVGDRYPQQSGTAFSTIFVIALVGNMAINKTFGYIAHEYGVGQYPKVMLGLLAVSAVLLHMVCSICTSLEYRSGMRSVIVSDATSSI